MAATIEPQMHEPTTGKRSTAIHHQLGLRTTLKSFTMLLFEGRRCQLCESSMLKSSPCHSLGEKVTTHAKVLCLSLHHVTSFGGEGDNACEPSEVILGNSMTRAEE